MPGIPFIFRVLLRRHRLERSRGWTAGRLRAHQQAAAAELRSFAYRYSPFYRQFHRGLESRPLGELPVLTKATLMENFDTLVTDRDIRLAGVEGFLQSDSKSGLYLGRYVALSTSGSTGRRGIFLFDPEEWLTAIANISRPMAWAGVRPSLFRPQRSVMIASTAQWHYSARVGRSLASRMLPSLRLDAAEPVANIVQQLNRWRPSIVMAYPSVLRQLAVEQLEGRLRISPNHIATSAEVLPAETRTLVREAWGVRVFDTYGATEYAPIAAECEYGRKHLVEDGALIEIEDERVLLTVFGRRTQPLIRYEISDMVRAAPGSCECGRPFQLIEAIEGRQEDVLVFGQVRVHPNAFHAVLENVAAAGWQVVQERDAVLVNLAGVRDPEVCDRVAVAVRRVLADHGSPVSVHVRAVDELQRGATGKAPLIAAAAR